MQNSQFTEIFENEVERCRQVLVNKGQEYGAEDRLHNFKTAAALEGISLKEALGGMMAKHTVSVYDMIRAEEKFTMAVWDEKIGDHINYLILLKAIIVEENQNSITKGTNLA